MSREACVERIIASVRDVFEDLYAKSREWPEGHWLYAGEQEVRRCALAIGCEMLQVLLDHRGPGHKGHRIEKPDGGTCEFKQYRRRTVRTLLGEVTVRRAVYQGANGSVAPLDDELGLRSRYSEGVEEALAFTAGQLTYEETVGVLEKTLGIPISVTKVQETATAWGEAAAAERSERLPDSGHGGRVAVGVDGAMVRTATRRRKRKDSREQDFQEVWREAKLGVAYGFDAHGQSRREKHYVGTLEGKDEFARTLWQLIEADGVDKAPTVVWLGDGAPWVWSLKDELLPDAEAVLDFHHAREHLEAVSRAVWPAAPARAKRWVHKQAQRLLQGKEALVRRELRRLSKQWGPPPDDASGDDPRKVLATNVGYFENNAHRMRYETYRRAGYPISSGVIESGCGHVVAQRMKITSRMSWNERRAEAILQLRCLIRSGQWDAFWPCCSYAA